MTDGKKLSGNCEDPTVLRTIVNCGLSALKPKIKL